jgi:ABC-2 type transport system permease protein
MVVSMHWILGELNMAWQYTRFNFREYAAERATFVMQTIGMMLNNSAFVIMWIVFLNVYGSANGWHAPQIIALNGFNAFVYGIAFTFFGGLAALRDSILNGSFDSVLLTPRALLTRTSTLVMRISAGGDIVFGILCLGLYALIVDVSFMQVAVLATLVIPACVIMLSIMLISSSIAFFIPDSSDVSRSFFELVFSPSMYPSGYFQGTARVMLLYVLPSIAIAGLPVEIMVTFSPSAYVLVWCLAIVWAYMSWRIFLWGLKRYESGNVTGARV